MRKYNVSPNNGIQGTDYCAYQIFDITGNVVAIARTNNNKLLELEKIEDNLNEESLLAAIKERFPKIDITDYIVSSLNKKSNGI